MQFLNFVFIIKFIWNRIQNLKSGSKEFSKKKIHTKVNCIMEPTIMKTKMNNKIKQNEN